MRRGLRYCCFILGDTILISASVIIAFLLKFDGFIPDYLHQTVVVTIFTALAVKLPFFYLYGLYDFSWSLVGIFELFSVFQAVTFSSLFLSAFLFLERSHYILGEIPRTFLIIDYIITLFFVGGFRAFLRVKNQIFERNGKHGDRILIVGAGKEGEQIVREILSDGNQRKLPIGFIDDDPAKKGIHIHGIKVLGGKDKIGEIVKRYKVKEILIANPSAPAKYIREIVEAARNSGVKSIKILPSLSDLLSGRVTLSLMRDVRVEDLLGREPVEINTESIESYIRNKIVLVTGAAGSIGSELSLQIAKFGPSRLILIDQEETSLFRMVMKLEGSFPDVPISYYVADVKDRLKMEKIFSTHLPQVVFHAAAYKHVPVMEENADEAVKNNVFGTLTVAETALAFGTGKFVLISTDKAVNPTSVMGATKRVAEMIVLKLNERGVTKFVAVRFGNVLGSRGSVLPIFQEQIRRGGPVTVTHPEMKRYFMTVTEAVLLVLQAGAMGEGGEVFVLDMGEPVKIVDLAKEAIRLSGFEPDRDIPIVYTGIRPGEKLFEELLTAEEGTEATKHRKIFRARLSFELQDGNFTENLMKLEALSKIGDNEGIVEVLQKMIPTYTPQRPFPSVFEKRERFMEVEKGGPPS
jgi:FlaA1/EpsC-like NDP-sugar epimerase